jgi:uncharacterized protein (TIGR00255 family)
MKSMTGFAQGRFEFNNISLSIQFKSVNHRFLDVFLKGTGINATTEKLIKEIIKDRVFRGKIEVIFDLFDANQRKCDIHFNEKLSSEILDELLYFKKRYKERISLSLDSLLRIPMIFHLDYLPDNYTAQEIEQIKTSIDRVFSEFLQSREQEGHAILESLLVSIEKIGSILKQIEHEAEAVEKELFVKFKEKISRYLDEYEIDERRIIQEAAILAEKACINEEINRIAVHNKRLKELLSDDTIEVKGRESDFLAQEMQRETHTIASKTTSLEAHRQILEMRREIEKIKQQVQNVE